METTSSPPITPVREYTSPIDTSPASTYRGHFSRRTSSFSSNHDRSPASIRSRHRFSNASQYSNDLSPDGGGGNGMGNLADELDQMDDFEEGDEDTTDTHAGDEAASDLPAVDGARDSGIDVSFQTSKQLPRTTNFSKPIAVSPKPPDSAKSGQEEKFSSDMEELISGVARMASYAGTSEDPLIPRFVGALQDLGNQSSLENGVQRMNTSTNSMTSHLVSQSKTLQKLVTSLYSPMALFTMPLDPTAIEEAGPLIDALLGDLPFPDPVPLQGVQKLVRDTDGVSHTLSQLKDTLQMGKHVTNDAARHLRDSQRMVAEMRRERESADRAGEWLQTSKWNDRVSERWCAEECRDIIGGFEKMCDSLRDNLVQARGGAAAAAG